MQNNKTYKGVDFKVGTKILREKLMILNGISLMKTNYEVIRQILFTIKEGKLFLTATDLKTRGELSIDINSEGASDGAFLIEPRSFLGILKGLSNELINICEYSENNISITTSTGIIMLPCPSALDFPLGKDLINSTHFKLNTGELLEGLDRVSYAMADDVCRPTMTGMRVEISEKGLKLIATDGVRLVTYSIEEPRCFFAQFFTLPRKTVLILVKALKKTSANEVNIFVDERYARFQFGDADIKCQCIEGAYPNHEKVIPKTNNNHVTVDRKAALACLKRMSVIANKNQGYEVVLQIGGNKVKLGVENYDTKQKSAEALDCVHDGADIKVGFNAKYLLDVFNKMRADKVRMELGTDPDRGMVARSVLGDGDRAKDLALLMPVMLG